MDEQTLISRMNNCANCEFRIEDECGLCGCNIETKVVDPAQSCPDFPSRWGPYVETKKAAKVIETPAAQEVAPVKKKGGCKTCQSRSI